ncbi:unnamed protein product, partial [Phaeothamnion confervicola]
YVYPAIPISNQVYDKGLSPYGSLRTAFGAIVRAEGWTALYQGLGPALIGNGVSWGGYFFAYEHAKRLMRRRSTTGELGSTHHLAAGMAAGTVMVFLTNPIWLIKTRMQLQSREFFGSGSSGAAAAPRPYAGVADALRTIVKEEGALALYKGVVPALVLCGQGALQFMAYEWMKERLPRHDVNTPGESLAMGGASKIFASLVTYPYQVVIKSRLQQRLTAKEAARGAPRYRGMLHCAAVIARCEGPRGFFKGCVAYAVRAAPASAITFVVYEESMKALAT